MRPWTIVAGVVVVALGALAIVVSGVDEKPEGEWLEVTREAFERRVPGSGELRSSNSIVVGCPPITRMWNFTITSIVPEGTEVAEGLPVLSFDAQELNERLQVERSRLETARSELEKTRLEQDERLEQVRLEQVEIEAKQSRLRQKLDVPETLQARIELEKLRLDDELFAEERRLVGERLEAQQRNRVASVANAESRVASLEHKVEELERSIRSMTVQAPRAGFVVHSTNWNGQKPKVGETVWVGQSILEIADLAQMEVAAELDERDARHVRVGQAVEIRLDAAPDRVFTGRVEDLGRLFHEKSPEVPRMVFDATISIDEPDAELMRPGMAVKVDVVAPSDEPVIQIPERAVRAGDDGPVVVVRRGGERKVVGVELGERWQGRVVVRAGLEEHDRVRVGGDAS